MKISLQLGQKVVFQNLAELSFAGVDCCWGCGVGWSYGPNSWIIANT